MNEIKNPWSFLTALQGDNKTDCELIRLTRKDELRIVTHMAAASRVSILYAFSGNGKSSLINAGVIPFFTDNGYVVFKMRPRPPWSIENPTQAFKDSIVREINLPLIKRTDIDILKDAYDHLKKASATLTKELENFIERFESKIKDSSSGQLDTEDFKAYLKKYLDRPLVEFVSHIQSALDDKTQILFICDQFEELFVHYGNTPGMDEFVSQLGDVWANGSLRVHLLFSMREDWVGSMIEFRKSIPDIFGNYFKLDPIKRSQAGDALSLPLESIGMKFEPEAVEQILDDLVQAYSINQKKRFSEVKLTPSPKDDPFIELPALQVLADEMWATRDKVKKPFSLSHYQSLKENSDKNRQTKGATLLKTGNPDAISSPAQVVLDNYLLNHIENTPGSEKLSPDEWRNLRIDCLYLLTDKTRHRRALYENILLEEVNQIRPTGLELPVIDEELLNDAIKPLVNIRLVREEVTKDNCKQYELAHDFTVRSAVRNWKNLDRQRTEELAIRKKAKKAREKKLPELEKNERKSLWFLLFTPLCSMFTLFIYSFFILNYTKNTLIHYGGLMSLGFLVPCASVILVGWLIQHKKSILLGSICVIAFGINLYLIDIVLTNSQQYFPYFPKTDLIFFAISFFAVFISFYTWVLDDINQRLKYPAFVERLFSILSLRFIIKMIHRSKEKYTFFGIVWSEFINIIVIVVPLTFIALPLSILVRMEDIYVWVILISLTLLVIALNAHHVYRTGKNIGFHSAGFIIQTTDGKKVKIWQALWRQLLFTAWILGNIFFGINLVLTTIFLIFTRRFSKYPRSIYDLLAGTAPVIKKVEFEEPTHKRKFSSKDRVK
jgi:hypothetical protein